MEIIITYDIPDKHVEFKKAMFELGYKDQIPGIKNCKIIYFPNTTLYHADKKPVTAHGDADSICKALNIELERCIATPWGPAWYASCGKPFKQ